MDGGRNFSPEGERVLARFGSCEGFLRKEGKRQYLLPACAGGGFCLLCGAALLAFDGWTVASSVFFALGAALIAAGTLLCAMTEREAGRAAGCTLCLTDRRLVYTGGAGEETVPLPDVREVYTERDDRFRRVPFDTALLSRQTLVVRTETAEFRWPYVDRPDDAAGMIRQAAGCGTDEETFPA